MYTIVVKVDVVVVFPKHNRQNKTRRPYATHQKDDQKDIDREILSKNIT